MVLMGDETAINPVMDLPYHKEDIENKSLTSGKASLNLGWLKLKE